MSQTNITVSGQIAMPDGSQLDVNVPEIDNTSSVGQAAGYVLGAAPTEIAVPTGAELVIIRPPSANTTAIYLKTVSGDTGIRLHDTIGAPAIGLDPSVTSIYLYAGAQMSATTMVEFG
ncbi:MAG: hypothetical protein KGL39_41345 [Patescibacteria group bacterium]|nr:hypothetical protein [Patescibacteria group bacterium]